MKIYSKSVLFLLLAFSFFACSPRSTATLTANAKSQPAPIKKTILVVEPYQSDLPQTVLSLQTIREELSQAQDLSLDVYYEYLDLNRFPSDAYQQELLKLLTAKYNSKTVDLVLISNEAALSFWLKHRSEILSADAPFVLYDIFPERLASYQLPPNATAVSGYEDFVQSVNWVLQALPFVNEIVVVHGAGKADQEFITSLDALKAKANRPVQWSDWSSLPLTEIKQRAANLPKNSIILYELMYEDADGIKYRPIDVLRELTAVSTVPVLSGYDQFIGSGTIGGYMYSIEEQAELAVRNALRILRGEPASAIPIVAGAGNHFIFDYLALQRWDIPLSALPPDSIIENRPPSFWETYQREIIAIGILIVCLILLILLLILVIRQLTKTRLDLSNLNANLENQVSQRTLELSAANSALMDEMLERKRAEEALRENETNLKALMNATEESMFLIENNGVIISLNETTATRLKSTTAEMLGHNIYDYLPPETSAHRKHMFSQAIETGQYLRFEDERLGALIENHVYPILDPGGQVTRLAIYGSDITERKRIERALHESNLRLRMALDAAKIGIHEWDVQANQLSWDERMYAFWEIQPDMPLSYELFIQGVHEDDRSRVAASIAQLTEPGSSGMHNIEYRVIGTQTGVERWLQLNGQMLFEEGRPVRLLGTAIDITEHKKIEQAEREQRTMAEALRDTSRALNSTLDFDSVLEEILKNVGRVVPIISANIALLDECGNLHFVRFLGYEEHPILEEELKTIGFSMEKSAIYKTVYETGQPMIIPDTHADPRWVSIQPGDWIRSFAVLPFCVKNQVVGFLNLDSPTLGMYTAEHIQNLQAFADQAALAIENARLYTDVQELAITDTLTGLLNRRGLFQLGEREVERAIRFQHPLTLVMFDIDHFKLVNDTYGHPLGDRILCAMAKCSRTLVRTVDIVTRYGGDEFILLLPETDQENGVLVAERLRKTVEQMTISVETDENTTGRNTHVTISLGISTVTQNTDSIQSIITRADEALYSAKQSGRNRVVMG